MLLRVMTERDIQSGLRLNTLSGWNQTAADWRLFLKQSPSGCFVMERGSTVVGTATTLPYGNRFAWIGMVLVDPEFRKMGIGTQLLHKTIEYLDQSRIPALKLDATPLGKPLYTKLGFVTEFEIERWILKRPPRIFSTTPRSRHSDLSSFQLAEILKLDEELFGADRGLLLRALQQQSPEFTTAVSEDGLLKGYSFGRCGLFADHLGPWMASSRASAEQILQSFLQQSLRETLIVDCMKSNPFAIELLGSHGFSLSRPLTRMVRGLNAFPGSPDSFCGILGPEFG
jgi:GNAT superfamily N-acetyltransferase